MRVNEIKHACMLFVILEIKDKDMYEHTIRTRICMNIPLGGWLSTKSPYMSGSENMNFRGMILR
jgi:hypothetical protein